MGANIITWIVVGAIAGLLGRLVMPGAGERPAGVAVSVVAGMGGALVAGAAWYLLLNQPGVRRIDPASGFVAFAGSCIVLGALRSFGGRRSVA